MRLPQCLHLPLLGALIAASVAHAAPAAREPTPIYRQLRDWLLVCDNTRRCEARALVENASAIISIEREAGPDTPVALRIRGKGVLSAQTLNVDGDAQSLPPLTWQSDQVADGSSSVLMLAGDAARQAIAVMLAGQVLQVDAMVREPTAGLGGEAGNTQAFGQAMSRRHSISLAGMTAALVAMDDWQRRLDTASALVRTGPLPESRAHAPWPMPRVVPRPSPAPAADRSILVPVHEARQYSLNDECDGGPAAPRDRVAPLTASDVLVFLECRRGAYQSSFIPLRVKRDAPDDPARLILPWTESALAFGTEKDFEPVYEPATGTLTMTGLGRGQGDCGFLAIWQFNGQAFDLAYYSEQQICAGLRMDWPVHYRTRSD